MLALTRRLFSFSLLVLDKSDVLLLTAEIVLAFPLYLELESSYWTASAAS